MVKESVVDIEFYPLEPDGERAIGLCRIRESGKLGRGIIMDVYDFDRATGQHLQKPIIRGKLGPYTYYGFMHAMERFRLKIAGVLEDEKDKRIKELEKETTRLEEVVNSLKESFLGWEDDN